MNNSKKFIIAFIVVIIAVISIIVVINKFSFKDDGNDVEERDFVKEKIEATKGKIQPVDSISDFELARICLQKFYIYYAALYDDNIGEESLNESDLEYYKSEIASVLTDNYKEKYGIDSSNIDQKLKRCDCEIVEIYNVYYATNYGDTKVYFIRGLLRNSGTFETEKFENTLYVDNTKQSFEVSLENDLEISFDEIKPDVEVSYVIPESIWSGNLGKFSYPSISYEEFSKRAFDNIRNLLLFNVDVAYDMLSDSSKERFSSPSALKEYVDNNKRDIFLMTFGNYETNMVDKVFVVTAYDSHLKYSVTMNFETFSNLTFDIKEF